MAEDEGTSGGEAVHDTVAGSSAGGVLPGTTDALELETVEACSAPDTYRATFDRSQLRPSMAVVAALSTITGTDMMEIDPPLYAAVDPTSLDTLLESKGDDTGDTCVEFSWLGYDLEVTSDGRIGLEPHRPQSAYPE